MQHTPRLQLRFRLSLYLSPTVQLLSTPSSGRAFGLPVHAFSLLAFRFITHLERYVRVSDWVKLALAVSVLPTQFEVYTSYTVPKFLTTSAPQIPLSWWHSASGAVSAK